MLLAVVLGQRERLEDWLELGRGLVRTVEELWPDAGRQRCSVHRLRNILARLPRREDVHRRVQSAYWAALDNAASPAEAEAGLRSLVELEREYPSAAACLADDLPALCAHLRFPLHLRRRLRSTNLLERSLGEVQRRVRVIGRFTTLIDDGPIRAFMIALDQDATLEKESLDGNVSVQVLIGELEVKVGRAKKVLHVGDLPILEPGSASGATAIDPSVLLITIAARNES